MPQRPIQHKIRDLAENILSKILLKKNWVIVSRQNQNDYGVDLDIQMVDKEEVTGNFFFCQLKGTENIAWTDAKYSFYLEKSKAHYLLSLNVPTIIALVDTTTEEIYWKSPFDHREADKSLVFDFQKDQPRLDIKIEDLSRYLREWMVAFSFDNVRYTAAQFHQSFVDLWEHAQWDPDFGTKLEPEMDIKFRNIYLHIIQLRLLNGLNLPLIIPISAWEIRNDSFPTESSGIFLHQIFKEAMHYIRPRYQEVVDKIKLGLSKSFYDEYVKSYLLGIQRVEERSSVWFTSYRRSADKARERINEVIEKILLSMGVEQSFSYDDVKKYRARTR